MLAHEYHKHEKKVTFPCFVQPKLDGVRCLAVAQGGSVTLLSRSGKLVDTLPEINGAILEGLASFPEGFILDGEIYSDELTFQQIIECFKKKRDNSSKIRYRVYDLVNDEPQYERWQRVTQIVGAIESELVNYVRTYQVDSPQQIKALHDQFVQEGNEGAMVRLLQGTYQSGSRSHHLLKFKEFDETEFYFVRFEKGAREEDLLAVCHTKDETAVFRAKMVGSREQKKAMEQTNYSGGCLITIKHFGWTDDRLPRFPIGKAIRDYD